MMTMLSNTENGDAPVSKTPRPDTAQAEAWFNEHVARSRKKPFTAIAPLTPEVALVLMQHNPNNRPIRPAKLEQYARDMREGRWSFNGEAISISIDGFLNDGQHRCSAVIKSCATIEMLFVFGVTRESRLTVDQGVARSTGNYLSMSISNANRTAAAASMIWQYETLGELRRKQVATKTEILQVAIQHLDEIQASIAAISTFKISQSQVIFSHWLLSKTIKDNTLVGAFFDKLIHGHDLGPGDPILYCRNRLMQIVSAINSDPQTRVELILRTWNQWIANNMSVRHIPLIGTLPKIQTKKSQGTEP